MRRLADFDAHPAHLGGVEDDGRFFAYMVEDKPGAGEIRSAPSGGAREPISRQWGGG